MQIGGVTSGYSDPMRSKASDLLETVSGGKSGGPGSGMPSAASLASIGAAADVLQRYDVTSITPSEFSEMAQRLFEAGVINDRDLGQLATVRLDLEADGIEPDESVNLLDYYQRKIEDTQRATEGPSGVPAALTQRLDWIEKFAMVQENPARSGLNEVI